MVEFLCTFLRCDWQNGKLTELTSPISLLIFLNNQNHLKYLEDVGRDDDLDHPGLVARGRKLQLLVLIVDAELMGAVMSPLWSRGVTWCGAHEKCLSQEKD